MVPDTNSDQSSPMLLSADFHWNSQHNLDLHSQNMEFINPKKSNTCYNKQKNNLAIFEMITITFAELYVLA